MSLIESCFVLFFLSFYLSLYLSIYPSIYLFRDRLLDSLGRGCRNPKKNKTFEQNPNPRGKKRANEITTKKTVQTIKNN